MLLRHSFAASAAAPTGRPLLGMGGTEQRAFVQQLGSVPALPLLAAVASTLASGQVGLKQLNDQRV